MNRRSRRITDTLIRWFGDRARDLPWRSRRTGYTALVSETMLQQTQVSRVVERYRSFIRRFPTVRALADADEQDVLSQWQGLGYYRRARNLHAAARMIVDRYQGRVPREVAHLRTLPGVGRYTAGAVASIVFERPEPIVDGNVKRVLSRLEANDDPDGPERERWCWDTAQTLVEHAASPGVFNEALMELGATVCLPRNPECGSCPVARQCRARARGLQDRIPAPGKPTRRRTLFLHAVVVKRNGKVLLEQRPAEGIWAGMWQTPTLESPRRLTRRVVEEGLAVPVERLRREGGFEHRLSHRTMIFDVYVANSRARRGIWRSEDDLGDLPMSNAHRKVLRLGRESSGSG